MTIMEQEKKYFAFISYCHKDEKWAKWLQHELEQYRPDVSYGDQIEVKFQEMQSIFRDVNELSAGNLSSQIERALANSQNLIVICSPQAVSSSKVNQEVMTFISLGKANNVFPFIVEGDSPQKYFPPALQNLPKPEEELNGSNVNKIGRYAAFIKIVAGMQHINFHTLIHLYEGEKEKEIDRYHERLEERIINSTGETPHRKQSDIFLSYSRRNLQVVRKIKETIEQTTQATCWVDLDGIESGTPKFTKSIINAINSCPIFLFMLSEESQKSENALKELDFAYKKYKEEGKKVVIVYIEKCEQTDEFSFDYGKADTVDWNDVFQREKLFRDLRSWINFYDKRKSENGESQCTVDRVTKLMVMSAVEKARLLYREALSVRERIEEMNSELIEKGYVYETETEEAFRRVRLFMNYTEEYVKDKVQYAVFSSNKQIIASVIRFGQIHIWDVASGKLMSVLTEGRWGYNQHISVNNKGTLVSVTSDNNHISIWESSTLMLKFRITDDNDVKYTYFTSDDKMLVAISPDDTISAWDINSGKKVMTIKNGKE